MPSTPFRQALQGGILLALGLSCSPAFQVGTMPSEVSCFVVLPLDVRLEMSSTTEMLSEFLALDLFREGARGVLGPQEVRQLFLAAGDPLPPVIDPYWAREIGRKLNVEGVIFGSIARVPVVHASGEPRTEVFLNVDAHFLEVKTGQLRWTYAAKDLVSEEAYVEQLNRYSLEMARALIKAHGSGKFGAPGCWTAPVATRGSVTPAPVVVPTPLPAPLDAEQEKLLQSLLASGGLVLEANMFEERTARMTKSGVPTLRSLAAVLISPKGPRFVRVAAHLDDSGDISADLKDSMARAQAIKVYLVTLGVDGARIRAEGKGGSLPIVPNLNRPSRLLNRRVEIRPAEEGAP